MIKEKIKKSKYNYKKNNFDNFIEYLRTIIVSFFVAIIITSSMAFHAKNEMTKNVFITQEERDFIDKKVATEVVSQTNLLKDLKNKNYSVCIQVGNIYKKAGKYKDAQKAYELAMQKSKKTSLSLYHNMICVLVAQENFTEAEEIMNNIKDISDKNVIKFKTRANLTIGDKYYSVGKFLSAAKYYEKAKFYYDKFSKKDEVIDESIKQRIQNSYIEVADIMVASGFNSEAVRFLHKAKAYNDKNFNICYKLAIILADLDPEASIKYFETLLKECPQKINYVAYENALVKSANIADLDGRTTKAKYYRYKIRSIDMFINRKVVYIDDINISIKNFNVKKNFFKYPLDVTYQFLNSSNSDIINLKGDFVLCEKGNPIETIEKIVSNKAKPLLTNSITPKEINVKFRKNIYTKKELENFTIKVYLYKDEKYKTLVFENYIPKKSF